MHEQWQTDRGLPQSSVFCLAQDRDGFLWFGTESGLVRFDGAKFRVFQEQNPEALHNRFVSSLLVAGDGAIWAGTRNGGLVCFRDEKFENRFPELNGLGVYSLAESRDGSIWVGTTQGLKKVTGNTLHSIDTAKAFSEPKITALLSAGDGSLWVGNASGDIARLADGKFESRNNPLATRHNVVTAIREDAGTRTMWVSTDGEGLWRLREGVYSRIELSGREAEYIQSLLLDNDGSVWCGTEHDGIVRYKAGEISTYNGQDGLSTDSVLSLFRDRENSVWTGTLFGGLHRLNRGSLATYGRPQGLPADTVTCVVEIRPELLWLGTKEKGLWQMADRKFEPIAAPGLSKEIRAMLRTRDGDVWAGGNGGGLVRFRNGQPLEPLTQANGLVANDVTALFENAAGEVWIGSKRDGVTVLNPKNSTVLGVFTNAPLRTYIRCFAEDNSGAIWIGTQRGLVRFANGQLENVGLGRFSDSAIRSIVPDAAPGSLWIGTRDDGLLRFTDGNLFQFEERHGLVQSRIYQLLRARDQLWLAGSRGIEAVSFSDLEAVSGKQKERVDARFYTERDGLRTPECGGDSSPSAALSADGTLWFGTRRGLALVQMMDEPESRPEPKVVIETVRLDDLISSTRGFRRVPAGTSRVQFSYTAPALADHSRLRFSYKLEGVDKHWIEAGSEREAFYHNLAPGEYTFKVRPSDWRGQWAKQPTSLSFVVVPRFYQTGWFYGAVVVVGAGLVRGLYRWRISGMQKLNKKLEELVQLRTRELEETNLALEGRVQTRTVELTTAYDNLQSGMCERERVEAELAASEGRFRRVVESGMVGILFWDAQGRISDANDTFLKMVDYTREELNAGAIYWSRLTPPEHARKDALGLEEIARSGVCAPFEKEYFRKDGSRFPVLLGGASLSSGARDGVCFVLDISERKASEEQVRHLAQSLELRVQERTRELARINEQLAGEVQERKRVAIALSAFSQLGQKLHGSRTEAEAANIIALTAKSLIPHDLCSIELYGSDQKLYPVVTGIEPAQPAGEKIRSSISVSIRNGTRVIGVIALKSSVPDSFRSSDANTLQALGDYCGGALDRIHAEEARRETERRFVAFMANAPALAWMKDSEFRYVFTNRMFQKFTGLTAEEIEGRTDRQLWPEAISMRIRGNDEQVLERDSTIETQETFRRANEEMRTLLTFRFPFTTAVGERFIAGMAIDISEQKRAEEALHRLPQAIIEAQEQERRRLARELHDGVNQAIASAKFRIQTAENQILRGDQKWQESCSKSKEMLDSVLHQVRRLSHNLRPGELDDLGLLAAARTAFQEFEDRTGIQVHFAVTGVEERLDLALESTFYRVIQEALTNIERHSKASAVDIHLTQNLSGVSLEISDNGVGFDVSADREERSGLGLLHMRERANLVGAGFVMETAPGEGVRIAIHVSSKGVENG